MEQRPNEAELIPRSELAHETSAASSISDANFVAPSPSMSTPASTFDATYARAGFWLRFVAFTIDTVILGVFALVLFLAGAVVTSMGDGIESFPAASEESAFLLPLWISGVLTASAAYFTILHGEYGQTIGKNLLGLEVRTRQGDFLSYSQALFRWLAYGVSAGPCGLGFLWVALNPGKRGWHDLLANTLVVTLEPPEL